MWYFFAEDRILIKVLRQEKGYGAKQNSSWNILTGRGHQVKEVVVEN